MRLAALAVVAAACGRDVPSAELDRLHTEAKAANAEAMKAHAGDETAGFTLTIGGHVDRPTVLRWNELLDIATTHVVTQNAQNPSATSPTDFEGLLLSDVVKRFGGDLGVEEITAVSEDGFRATVKLADAMKYRMLLAVKADGAPIPKSAGGPIFLVHPWTEAPETKTTYVDRFWAFYVSHLVIGTEAPTLVVAGKRFEGDALAKLPPAQFDGLVGFKVEWPSDTVHLRGVTLVDALAAAGATLPPGGRLRITGKSPRHHDPAQPIEFLVTDLARCKPILAWQVGLDEKPIPARLGGPIVLAHTPCGDGYGVPHWVTFVETVDVVSPEPR